MGLPKDCEVTLHARWRHGEKNLITDVTGVRVGHVTRKDGDIHTGVTAILPHEGNMFQKKVMAGAAVINGFGKSTGLVQVEELGTIETPIMLTNTLSVGTVTSGLVKYMLAQNEDIGVTTGTVNCLVTECNDGRLNDIRGFHVEEDDVSKAIAAAGDTFEEGAVGGGTGMICFGLKGGIGSSSRLISIDGRDYTLGALVMSNFGSMGNLVIDGVHYDKIIEDDDLPAGEIGADDARRGESECKDSECKDPGEKDNGSVIIVIATDIPLSERQLKRVAKRAMIGLGRVGSYCGNGSGDISIAFTTANTVDHYSEKNILSMSMLHDDAMDKVFSATAETVEEAVISSLYHGETTVGIRGKKVLGLRDFLSEYSKIQNRGESK